MLIHLYHAILLGKGVVFYVINSHKRRFAVPQSRKKHIAKWKVEIIVSTKDEEIGTAAIPRPQREKEVPHSTETFFVLAYPV
jgi:hypothetical protein